MLKAHSLGKDVVPGKIRIECLYLDLIKTLATSVAKLAALYLRLLKCNVKKKTTTNSIGAWTIKAI